MANILQNWSKMYSPLKSGYQKSDFAKHIIGRHVAVIATPHAGWGVQVATVFYATDNGEDLYMKFHVGSDKGQQILKNPKVALAIYDHDSTYTEKHGIQLLGECRRVTDREELLKAIDIFSNEFPGARERFAPIDELLSDDVKSTLFHFRAVSGKMLTPEGYSDGYQKLQ